MAKCPCCGHEFTDDEAIFIAKSYAGSIKTAKKSTASAENGRKYGGRPKGAKNKAPRADKGVPRGPRNKDQQTESEAQE